LPVAGRCSAVAESR